MKKGFLSICLAAGVNLGFFFFLSLLGAPLKSSLPAGSSAMEVILLPRKEASIPRPPVLQKVPSPTAVHKPVVPRTGIRQPGVERDARASAGEAQKRSSLPLSLKLAPYIQGAQTDFLLLEPPVEKSLTEAPQQKRGWQMEEVDVLPVKIRHVQPEYPGWALEQGLEGSVSLIFLIDQTGKVRDVRITQSSQFPAFDASAVQAVKQWRYRPAMKDGPVAVWQPCIVRFRLNQ